MTYKLAFTKSFGRELKKLKKKYPTILADLDRLAVELLKNPTLGNPVYKNCYKVRVSISGMRKGKSGSARLITYVVYSKLTIFLIAIFTKSERTSISDKEIEDLIKNLED